ncbi:MAG: glycosyltransferase family 2 protein [Anaerolineales bacterium]|nr:glycosyltransferase family 2 protein [Anaerolineales bacterium]
MPTLSIIILNWNTADLLLACLHSIQTHVTLDYEIIVVDNASTDDSVAQVRAQFPQVRLLPQNANLGFSKGNNIGITAANAPYLLLLNPDTEVHPGALEALVAFLETHPQAGIIGPTLWNPDGSLQPSTSPLPTLWIEFLRQTMLFRLFPTAEMRTAMHNETQRVTNITGAAMCIRRECLTQIGLLDEQIFMFYEDTDWCKRARDAGWELWFVACSGVMHVKAAASSRFARTRTLLDSQRSTIYYFRKHYGRSAITWLRLITFCGAIVRTLRAMVNWLLKRNQADQAARLKAYGRMFIWALSGKGLEREDAITAV